MMHVNKVGATNPTLLVKLKNSITTQAILNHELAGAEYEDSTGKVIFRKMDVTFSAYMSYCTTDTRHDSGY